MVERIGKEEGKLLAQDELQRAIDELNAARILHENKFYYKSISTAYYSVYHAAKAALLLKGIVPQSHEGVVRMFSLYYVKVNEISIDIGKIIGRLMKLREEADYYPETSFSCDDSLDTLEKATMFVENIKNIVKM
ncbi:MAG: HEPN domain-containing protein [Candidatus Kuenenia sp.]|nr:HEPN domain-containing protein [Candidatus Kuenenia hertensis]